MTADQAQGPLPLLWFLALVGAGLAGVGVAVLIDAAVKRRAQRELVRRMAYRAHRDQVLRGER